MSWKKILKEKNDDGIMEKNKEKPDYIDLDKDGDTKESMKQAAKDAKKKPKKSKGRGFTR